MHIKIGSIRLLEAGTQLPSSNIYFHNRILFILRSFLLLMLAAMLAEPVFNSATTSEDNPGWVLIDPVLLTPDSDRSWQAQVDSLERAGYNVKLLAPDFPPMTAESDNSLSTPGMWSLLPSLDESAPTEQPAHIFTAASYRGVPGARAHTSRQYIWHFIDPPDRYWIDHVSLFDNDSIAVAVASTQDVGLRQTYMRHMLPNNYRTLRKNGLSVRVQRDRLREGFQLTLRTRDGTVHDSTFVGLHEERKLIKIVHTPNRTRDAIYVAAAARTAVTHLNLSYDVRIVEQTEAAAPYSANYLIWLSDLEVPTHSLSDSIELILEDVVSDSIYQGETPLVLTGMTNSILAKAWQVGVRAPHANELVISGSKEMPILTRRDTNGISHYRFQSRFHPDWNDLSISAALPDWLGSVLLDMTPAETTSTNKLYGQRASVSQILPSSGQNINLHEQLASTKALEFIFWLLLISLLALERWYSTKLEKNRIGAQV